MADTARAAVFFGPGKPFEIRPVPIPEIEPEAVLIRVTHANICGSDLHFWRGDAPLRLPDDGWIFGHEMTGTVARLGSQVKTDSLGRPLKEGDRVLFAKYAGTEFKHEGDDLLILSEKDVLAVIVSNGK